MLIFASFIFYIKSKNLGSRTNILAELNIFFCVSRSDNKSEINYSLPFKPVEEIASSEAASRSGGQ
jgi:hypothetical protein